MVRLSGKSVLYLPQDHCPGSLVLPTCIRATAQYLAQHTAARGVFRIPGSIRVVTALFDYYCQPEKGGTQIAGTVRSANLPIHIDASVHDVASAFKRLLSVLPGGILGTLSIFDAFVAINSSMNGEPEFPRTKQTKVRARLIALAIGTIESQFRRELICAVFGLLSLVGRTAELAPREDDNRRPLPTSDLMGYSALGIVFGPLLVGDLLESYNMNIATPDSGLLVFPLSSKKLQKVHRGRRKSTTVGKKASEPPAVDKIYIANSIAEMLIANWRDIVRQMKALGTHRKKVASVSAHNSSLRPSISEYFSSRPLSHWNAERRESAVQVNRDGSPEAEPTCIGVKRQRPRSQPSVGSNRLQSKPSGTVLSPTAEEGSADGMKPRGPMASPPIHHPLLQKDANAPRGLVSPNIKRPVDRRGQDHMDAFQLSMQESDRRHPENARVGNPEVPLEDVPPRTSSKQRSYQDDSTTSLKDLTLQQGYRPSLDEGKQSGGRDASYNLHLNLAQNQDLGFTRQITGRLGSERAKSDNNSLSRQSQVSCSPEEKRRRVTPKRQDVDSHEFERMAPLPNGSRTSVNTEGARCSRPSTSAVDHTSPQLENNDPNKTEGRQVGSTFQDCNIENRRSIDLTPRNFYAAMRVPPTLSGEPSTQAQQSSSKRLSSFDSLAQVTPPGKLPASGSTPAAGWKAADSLSLSPKATGQLADRVMQFEPELRSKSLPPNSQKSYNRSRVSVEPQAKTQTLAQANDPVKSGNRVGVRAMAAMFEGDDDGPKAEVNSTRARQGLEKTDRETTRSPSKTLRTSKSGPLGEARSPTKASWSIKSHEPQSRKPAGMNSTSERTLDGSNQRTSVGDSVAARAAAIAEAEKQSYSQTTKRPSLFGRKPTGTVQRQINADSTREHESQDQGTFNLRTIIPHQEQPPVAQHLTFTRPPSSSSSVHSKTSDAAEHGAQTPMQRPGSTSSLHAQIRQFQRQLDTKTDEISQLRRQLEAQEDSDIGTLSEQLREAKREAQMWKERAEAAERRVRVFKRFTAKLKGIREAAVVADEKQSRNREPEERDSESGDLYEGYDDANAAHQVRFVKGQLSDKRASSEDSGHTEDAGVVTARIRKCLHGGHAAADGAFSDEALDALGLDSPTLSEADRRMISPDAHELWRAAQELLESEENKTSST